jgi:cephalosporin hydroxylase
MNIQDVQGWFGDGEMNTLRPYVEAIPEHGLLVEIGTFHGKSTLFFRQTNPNIYILTNDICSQEGIGTQENQTTIGTIIPSHIDYGVLAEGNIFQVRGSSHEVVKTFNWPIDFLFIDSEHSFKDTLDTLNEWAKFVKPGHYIGMHDYSTAFPGVEQGIREYMKTHPITIEQIVPEMAILKT